MERVPIEEIESVVDSATIKRPLTDALSASHVAINYYELAPGDSFAYGYHMHEDQEEIFIIQSGTATFETENGVVDVGEGEVIRFAPGEYQRGRNTNGRRVKAIAIGVPQESGESEILRQCTNCEDQTSQTIEWSQDRNEKRTRCDECGQITSRFR